MQRLEEEERARIEKEKEKQERKRKREEKAKQKSKKARSSTSTPNPTTPATVVCPECDVLYEDDESDDDWIECEVCHNWSHVVCVGLEFLTNAELDDTTYICDSCSM